MNTSGQLTNPLPPHPNKAVRGHGGLPQHVGAIRGGIAAVPGTVGIPRSQIGGNGAIRPPVAESADRPPTQSRGCPAHINGTTQIERPAILVQFQPCMTDANPTSTKWHSSIIDNFEILFT